MKEISVRIGIVNIGNGFPVAIQSMCNTPTSDVSLSVDQCIDLYKAGADIIRLTTQGIKEVDSLREIKNTLRNKNIQTPLVADIHFSPDVAFEAAKVADKVRINPGNFSKDPNLAKENYVKLISICKEYKTAVRIGVNHGSLDQRIVEKYGNSPFGMMKSAYEWIELSEELGFDQIVISLKASNTLIMTEAYRLLYAEMNNRGVIYPLHLGVTEAGNAEEGRIKSAVGIASLLADGIGSTIRVSLTENPINEIAVAKRILRFYNEPKLNNDFSENFSFDAENWSDLIIDAACKIGPSLLSKKIDDFTINTANNYFSEEKLSHLKEMLLQASRRKFFRPEYIACPGCGRTLFNLEKVFDEVKMRTSHLKGLNIAVMGCIVNGPGEMADADYGYVGEGRDKVSIYRGKLPIYRSVPQNEAIDVLLRLIEEDQINLKKTNNI